MAIDGHHIVVGVFDESTLADMALEHLQNAGFHSSQIYCSDPGKKPDAESGRGVRGPLMEYWPGSKDLFTPDPSAAHDALAQGAGSLRR